ncbi:signal peptide peptidase SppA, 36K type [Thermocrinis albus DSM 14484]|uniref:Signal peptide peptidase SppA, 36K type n=1 Tax=Thermocrinis albus (strain DSM 14484 / JCM 11386 / HI 11/12) TaxID=638303 RepID=D3SMV2_THEAH|nr:signal peptide peptidase SppA [Thermocrinis albus]ADC90082.1 signal peptide peptidase SppA, 36K type [Thermocrinis albus DSM 14484]
MGRWIKRVLIFFGILFSLGMLGTFLARFPIGDRIAVVKVEGVITDPQAVVSKMEKARLDPSVKALVLRVESPGGSVGASQEIYREVERFRQSGKPVVVSMGNVAASGGYYISAPANVIYANPGTITGSIGVIIQHTDVQQLLEKLGIKTTAIKTGKFKDTLSPFRELTPEERQYLQNLVEDAYSQFIEAILRYRKGKVQEDILRQIADGRILTGKQAKELGLVDELGDLQDAIQKAKELARVPQARVFYMEDKKGFLKRMLEGKVPSLQQVWSPLMIYYMME